MDHFAVAANQTSSDVTMVILALIFSMTLLVFVWIISQRGGRAAAFGGWVAFALTAVLSVVLFVGKYFAGEAVVKPLVNDKLELLKEYMSQTHCLPVRYGDQKGPFQPVVLGRIDPVPNLRAGNIIGFDCGSEQMSAIADPMNSHPLKQFLMDPMPRCPIGRWSCEALSRKNELSQYGLRDDAT